MNVGRRTAGAALAVVVALLAAGCSGEAPAAAPTASISRLPADQSWAPAPVEVDGARTVATTSGTTFALHTKQGDVTFVPGMNLGATTPGHYPGEVAIETSDYRRWFAQMGAMGIRSVRIYTIHRPAFYTELLAYNTSHPDAPLYLMHGIYPPDESYTSTRNVFDPGPTAAFDAEMRDAVAAVTGKLERAPMRGRAFGTWTADVSSYVMGWIAGAEMDPVSVRDSDRLNARQPAFAGRYFVSVADASPTERWLAARLDVLAGALERTGTIAPLAFVNWPTTDPLRHPTEPNDAEDLVGIDANRVQPTSAWRGGYFASYHAYPYFPDFQRHEPAYQKAMYGGRKDPYAGYLTALKKHHDTMPTMVTEFGVPSSIGSAHAGPLGRDQGDHNEREAMAINAELLREIKGLGLAGAFVFEWTDEWFKSTWNTKPRQRPLDRKALWHSPWTNEQHFGVVATDAATRSDPTRIGSSAGGVRSVEVSHDESWMYLTVRLAAPPSPLVLGFDVIATAGEPALMPVGGGRSDGADVVVVADAEGVRQYGRADQDGRWLDQGKGAANDLVAGTWALQRLTTNHVQTVPTTKRRLPAEFLSVGDLRRGDWTPGRAGGDSRAQYSYADSGTTLQLRLAWDSLMMSDPSSRTALLVRGPDRAETVTIAAVGVRAIAGGGEVAGSYAWETWDTVSYKERLKDGADVLAEAFHATAATR